jgi:hypothetical protein
MLHFVEKFEKSEKTAKDEQQYKLMIEDSFYIVSNFVRLTKEKLKEIFPDKPEIQSKFVKPDKEFLESLNTYEQSQLIENLADIGGK